MTRPRRQLEVDAPKAKPQGRSRVTNGGEMLPVVRNVGHEREMVMMRWGMPPLPRTPGPPVTNICNTSSPHWRMWLKPENRCLVPANSIAEPLNPETKKKDVVWFALNEARPPFASIDVAIPPIVWSRTALRACKIRIDDALAREA